MAAAEARAAWQRTANRCFVQEDAKRAPKIACCPSSSTSSKLADAVLASATDGSDHPTVVFMPLNRIPSSSNLPPDARWWLQQQPNFGCQKGLINEQLNAFESDVEIMRASMLDSASEFSGECPQDKEGGTFVDITTCLSRDSVVGKQDVGVYGESALELRDLRDYYEVVEMDPVGSSVSKQCNELCFDSESVWFGSEKTEPWWRIADRDELAFLVAQKSLGHVENCDLPPPQKTHCRTDPFSHLGNFDHDVIYISSSDHKVQSGGISKLTKHAPGGPTSGRKLGRQWALAEDELSVHVSDRPSSCSSPHKDVSGMEKNPESDPTKAQLLEALCHSQTRAREAENEVKQAQAEKEHIIKLFFRQASYLFAYKQWFQLLQLETFYLQIKSNDQPISTLFPLVFPRTPSTARKLRKSCKKAANSNHGKQGQPRCDISKYAVAFALGLSLVGAGFLLGWTVGWMLPTF